MSQPRKSVLITGCSAGSIGDAVAREFHRRGFHVFATARSFPKTSHLKSLGIETLVLDVTSLESIQAAKETVSLRTGGTLDILFNNAGQTFAMTLVDTDLAAMRALYEVNVFSVVAMTQAFLPLVIESKGIIVNHGSMSSLMTFVGAGAYSSSKAAVSSISDTMRVELAPFGVRVVHLITGLCQSNIWPPETPPRLPANSVYAVVGDEMEAGMLGNSAAFRFQDADVYARKLVGDLVDVGRPAVWLYRGTGSTIVWYLSTFLWRGALDGVFRRFGGINKLSGKLKSA